MTASATITKTTYSSDDVACILDGLWRHAIQFPNGLVCKHYIAANILSTMEELGMFMPSELARAVVEADDETSLAWPAAPYIVADR